MDVDSKSLSMPRPPTIHTLESDLSLLSIYYLIESGELARSEAAERLGISERTLYRRMARARAIREDFEPDPDPEPEPEDTAVHLEITAGPRSRTPGGGWYDLPTD